MFVAFSWLIITVAVDFGGDYGRSSDEIGNGSLNVLDFKTTAEGVNDEAQSYRSRFESGDVDDVDDASGVFQVAGDIIGVITTPFNLLAKVGKNLLGFPEVATHTLLAILNLTLILAMWSLLRKGD